MEAARRNWQRLGFTLTPMGRHTGWGTANHAITFQDDYLALIGITNPEMPLPGRLRDALKVREGMFAIALATDDADAAHATLVANGLEPGDVLDMARDVEIPGQAEPARPRFRIIQLPETSTPNLDISLTQHLTPELVWRPEWQEHPNGATGIQQITVSVSDPASMQAPYERLFGPDCCSADGGSLTVETGRGSIRFVRSNTSINRITGAELIVRSLVEARKILAENDIPFDPKEDQILILGDHANGVELTFTET